jgi:cobalamin biosynthesis Mg chelatase CobN
MFPLTLRAMQGMRRHPSRSSGPPSFVLLSVLALLALACFPVLAQAEVQYEDEAPSVKVPPKKTAHHSETKAKSSDAESNGSTAPGGSGGSNGGSSSGGSSSGNGNNPSTGTGQSSSGKSPAGTGQSNSVGSVQPGEPVAKQEASDSSSSPLVPILIAIAVLAATSIGAVIYRQRRQSDDDGPKVSSPEPS